ncbi:MAG TPA: TIGR03621 family F420-dependent LLM class oxidoreductase [Candidatus Acidoferrum sp.]|nr:TIGR03621 family F420-dependent LLM class oxidoreductase [Candidatus Acidoferrum sp.]
MPKPFRFSVTANQPRSKADWMAFAQRVEGLGFDSLSIPDHFGPRLAIAPALVLAAHATGRLRVRSFVYDNDFRHPALLAQEIATIDNLTDGRFDFGIGAGWLKSEYDAAGLRFDPGSVRVERLFEALEIITRLLGGAALTYEGKHYQLRDLSAGFPPVQRPHPPIVIGGGGRRLLTLAAMRADVISVMPGSRPDGSGLEDRDASLVAFKQKIAWIKEAAGDRFDHLELNTLVQAVVITEDAHGEARRMAPRWNASAEELLDSPLLLIGTIDEIGATLERRREELGISSTTVFEKDHEDLARVIPRLRAVITGASG